MTGVPATAFAPEPEPSVRLVAPVTDQLSVLVCPGSTFAGDAAKRAITGRTAACAGTKCDVPAHRRKTTVVVRRTKIMVESVGRVVSPPLSRRRSKRKVSIPVRPLCPPRGPHLLARAEGREPLPVRPKLHRRAVVPIPPSPFCNFFVTFSLDTAPVQWDTSAVEQNTGAGKLWWVAKGSFPRRNGVTARILGISRLLECAFGPNGCIV